MSGRGFGKKGFLAFFVAEFGVFGIHNGRFFGICILMRALIEEEVVGINAVLESLDEGSGSIHDAEVAVFFSGSGIFGIGFGQFAKGHASVGDGFLAVIAVNGAGARHHQDDIAKGFGFGFADRGACGIGFARAGSFEQNVRNVVRHAGLQIAFRSFAEVFVFGEEFITVSILAITHLHQVGVALIVGVEFVGFDFVEFLLIKFFNVVDIFAI